MQTSAIFVAKTNIEFFKIYSVSTSGMDREEGRGEELSQCLHFLDKERSIFMILCRRTLWMDPEQKK